MFKYLIFFIFLFTKFTVSSQISFTSNQLIEPYLGFPNLGRLSAQIIDTSILEKQDQKFSGIGPSGFRYSYMLSDAFSIGIDLMYNTLNERYRTSQDVYMNNEQVNRYFKNLVPNFQQTQSQSSNQNQSQSHKPQQIGYKQQTNYNSSDTNQVLIEKLNYMINLLEEQQDERTNNVTEEVILYSFLGVFIIFVVDGFARVTRYTR